MKTKLNQNKLKLAIVSAMLVGSAGFSTAGYAATSFGNMVVYGGRCDVLYCQCRYVRFPNL